VRRAIWIAVLGVVAFAVVVLARAPVSWVVPERLAQQRCTVLDGTLWSGTCSGVIVNNRSIGDLTWEVHPLHLLIGQIAAHLTLANGAASGATDVALSLGGKLTLRNLRAAAPLDPQLLPEVPQHMRGSGRADVAFARIEHGVLTQIEGRIEAHDVEDLSGGHDTALGSFAVTFPPGASGDPVGRIHDLDGPLAVEGTLTLTRAPGFEIQGFIAPRQGASPEVVNNIAFLGSPDASGRREFAMSGTF
jgi:general secretion pathway protein N